MSDDFYKDCPQCGMERIPNRVRLCSACEVEERWAKQTAALQAELAAAQKEVLRLKADNAAKTDTLRWLADWPGMISRLRRVPEAMQVYNSMSASARTAIGDCSEEWLESWMPRPKPTPPEPR